MNYTKNAYERAERTLSERKNAAYSEQKQRYDLAVKSVPEIAKMTAALDKKKFELLRRIGSGQSNASSVIYDLKAETETINRAISELLVSNGFPEDYISYKFTCEKCYDTGYRDGIRCSCMTELLTKYTIEELNEFCTLKLHTFDEFRSDYYPERDSDGEEPRKRMELVYRNCIEYAKDFRQDSDSLFFYGKTGLGKTFLSSCIASELMKKGYSVVFFSIPSLFTKLEDEHFGRADTKTMELLLSADLVILDDLGSEFKTQFTESKLYEIVNGRLNLDKPVILSTNLSVGELQKMYNERIISRIIMQYAPMKFLGSDIRQIMRRNNYR